MHIINSEGKKIKITKKDLCNLPSDTIKLYCSYNQLTSLPELPFSLQELYCFGNQLTSLPELPPSLQKLYCSHNQLTSLPELPPSLQILDCSYNLLDKIYPDLKKETINLWNRTALFVQTKWRIKERVKLCPYHKLGRKHMEEEWEKISKKFNETR